MFFRKNKFQAPWNVLVDERIKKLLESPEKKKVIYIYEKADSSTFRYRVYNMCQALEDSINFSGIYFFESELPLLQKYIEQVSLFIFCRTRWSLHFDQFIEYVKTKKIPIIFDIDDLVFNLDKIPLVMSTLNVPFKEDQISHWFSYASRLGQLGKKCDATIGTNEYIGKHLQEVFDKPNFIINNFLNHQQIQASEPLFEGKQKSSNKSSFKLGYFSGSPSHVNDFGQIASEIALLLKEFPDITLEVGGFMEFPLILQPFVKKKRIIHNSFVDFVTLQKRISSVDVNLVPLVENEFTHCKSELKFFEAAIVGTVTLATPTFVFQHNISHEKTGYLCEAGDWYKTIKSLYLNKVCPFLNQEAKEYCLKKYSPKSQLSFIETMLFKMLEHP